MKSGKACQGKLLMTPRPIRNEMIKTLQEPYSFRIYPVPWGLMVLVYHQALSEGMRRIIEDPERSV
jgi:hypothetical protein